MFIGKLDQQIGIYSLATTNNFGQVEQTYSLVNTVWGYVTGSRGKEAIEAARINARETIRVLLRYDSTITVKHQINWNGQTYNIIHIDRTGRRQGELWLSCELVGAV